MIVPIVKIEQFTVSGDNGFVYRVSKKTLLKEKLITSLRSIFFGTPGILTFFTCAALEKADTGNLFCSSLEN